MTNPSLDEVIRRLVLAHADGEMKAIAVVFINGEGEPEIELAFGAVDVYKVSTSLDILKYNIMKRLMNRAAKKPKDRE